MAKIRLYVDYENVQSEGLRGISKLDPCCITSIIYSKKAEKIRVSEVMELMSAHSEIRFIEAENGTPNALDFQLLTLMLLDYADGKDDVFVVVSRDTGYDCAVRVAKNTGTGKFARYAGIEHFLQAMPRILSNLHKQAEESSEDLRNDEMTVEEEYAGRVDNSLDEALKNGQIKEVAFEVGQIGSAEVGGGQEMPDEEDNFVIPFWEEETDPQPKAEAKPKAFIRETEKKSNPSRTDRIQRHLYLKKGVLYSDADCGMIADALANSKNKMQFYQYFQKHSGKNGVEFYRRIRSEYDALAKI